jgi:L-lactate dehydrogenase complex protein LldG
MTETEKEIILSRIKKNVAESRRVHPHHDHHAASAPLAQTPPSDQKSLVQRFATELTNIGGHVVQVNSIPEANAAIEKVIERAERIAISNAPVLKTLDLEARLKQSGKTVIAWPGDSNQLADYQGQLMTADVGITGVSYALADTGTLVLLVSDVEGRLASLLPPVHVAVITADQIVADLSRLISELPPPPSGSCITFITGPSRTADIELTLTVGVHGPKELHVVMLAEQ